MDSSVSIRTIYIEKDIATFNAGGGIVSDSVAHTEYAETILKAKKILQLFSDKKDILNDDKLDLDTYLEKFKGKVL
jgi:para-aminobenzoate synthetase component 1